MKTYSQFIVEHNDGSSKNCKKGEYFCKDDHKCKPIPEGHHVMPNGKLMKGEKHSVKEEKRNCGCGKDPCITYGKKKKKHDCASKVKHEEFGIGNPVKGMHDLDESGNVTHYDVLFSHGVEKNVPVENLEIVKEMHHEHVIHDQDEVLTDA